MHTHGDSIMDRGHIRKTTTTGSLMASIVKFVRHHAMRGDAMDCHGVFIVHWVEAIHRIKFVIVTRAFKGISDIQRSLFSVLPVDEKAKDATRNPKHDYAAEIKHRVTPCSRITAFSILPIHTHVSSQYQTKSLARLCRQGMTLMGVFCFGLSSAASAGGLSKDARAFFPYLLERSFEPPIAQVISVNHLLAVTTVAAVDPVMSPSREHQPGATRNQIKTPSAKVTETQPVAVDEHSVPINFAPGDYKTAAAKDLNTLLAALPRQRHHVKAIEITGYSKSQTTLATEALAVKRARVVADFLQDNGVPGDRIQLVGIAQNHLPFVGAYPGADVRLTVVADSTQSPVAEVRAETPGSDHTAVTAAAGDVLAQTDTVVLASVDCTVQPGTLEANLVRLSEDHGGKPVVWNAPFDVPIEVSADIEADSLPACLDTIIRSVQASDVSIRARDLTNVIVIEES